MEEYTTKKENNLNKYALISVFVVAMFIVGFLFGGSLIYGLNNSKFDQLQSQILSLQNKENNTEVQNITFFYNETSLSNLYDDVKDSIVVISGEIAVQSFFGTQYSQVQGSGFVYDFNENMYVITNFHVVDGASDIIVTFSDGDSYSADVIGSDAYSDLAVLTVNSAPSDEFKSIDITSSSSLEVGEPVVAIGSPFGLGGTLTSGLISQLGRTISDSVAGSFPIANIIQTSAPINPGNSGGPLFNYEGNVIGITTAIIENSNGLGFAIPSDTILKEIGSLIQSGSYNQHSWLGISGADMSYAIAQEMNVNVTYGWLITQISSGGAADNAGLKGGNRQARIDNEFVVIGGDIIIAIDGTRIINGDSLMSYLEKNTLPNETVTFTIIRDNQQLDISVKLGTRPVLS
jgi:S1-C subfamily serine protease